MSSQEKKLETPFLFGNTYKFTVFRHKSSRPAGYQVCISGAGDQGTPLPDAKAFDLETNVRSHQLFVGLLLPVLGRGSVRGQPFADSAVGPGSPTSGGSGEMAGGPLSSSMLLRNGGGGAWERAWWKQTTVSARVTRFLSETSDLSRRAEVWLLIHHSDERGSAVFANPPLMATAEVQSSPL